MLVAGGFLLGLVLLREPILIGAARVLHVEDALHRADLVYLLNGDFSRATHAAKLYRQGWAPRVVIARSEDEDARDLGLLPNHSEVQAGVLRAHGVPDSAIMIWHWKRGVDSTTDDALALREYLELHPAGRVSVVTNPYHTRRARWNLRRVLKDRPEELLMSGAPHPDFSERDWWRSEEGLIVYVNEYLKFLHNWLYR